MGKIKVLVADDHPTYREGLRRLLQDEKDMEVVGKAADGEEAVKLAREVLPDVAIIDVTMPRLNGIEAAKQIKASCPATAILMISGYKYESYIIASLRAGAVGYLLKSAPLGELVNAIRLAHAGGAVFDLEAADKFLSHLLAEYPRERKALGRLQPREGEVLKLAAKGMSNKRIAEELVISERTVQTHLVNIFRKLGVTSRTEAVLTALKEGWLTLDDLPVREQI